MNARYCPAPGCRYRIPVDVLNARCPVHGGRQYGGRFRRPGTRQQRGYGKRWESIRALVLAEEPICRVCRREWSQEVDHIEPAARRPDLHYVRSNLQGICRGCHREKTYRETIGAGRVVCDEVPGGGNPISSNGLERPARRTN
ncbi:MAG: HNH endonuclease [Bryobacteraceae bacterium]